MKAAKVAITLAVCGVVIAQGALARNLIIRMPVYQEVRQEGRGGLFQTRRVLVGYSQPLAFETAVGPQCPSKPGPKPPPPPPGSVAAPVIAGGMSGGDCCLRMRLPFARINRLVHHEASHCMSYCFITGDLCGCCDHRVREVEPGTPQYAYYRNLIEQGVIVATPYNLAP